MPGRISLAYGETPLAVELPEGSTLIEAPVLEATDSVDTLLEAALNSPIGCESLERLAVGAARITVVLSDTTRHEPRREMLEAIRKRLPSNVQLTIAIATGTHGPTRIDMLDVPEHLLADAKVINHDGHSEVGIVQVGKTARGTSIRVHECVVDTDLVIATGGIKPHYFAGFGAGCKAVFPGLGANHEIRVNHRLKQDPRSASGSYRDNPCRDDMEEAVARIPTEKFLLNVVFDSRGQTRDAVAGDIRAAWEVGAQRCDPLFRVRAPGARSFIVSDALPLTGSVYQASKLVAAIAPVVLDGATIVVAAQCPYGTGDVRTVNEAIYDIGLRPRLPEHHRIILVSDLPPQDVAPLYCDYAMSMAEAMALLDDPPIVFPHAGSIIVEPS